MGDELPRTRFIEDETLKWYGKAMRSEYWIEKAGHQGDGLSIRLNKKRLHQMWAKAADV